MFSMTRFRFSNTFYLVAAIVGVIFAVLGHLPDAKNSTSVVHQIFRKGMTVIGMRSPRRPNLNHNEQQYQIQVFSRDPLVILIGSFLNNEEITHLLHQSEGKYQPSKVYLGHDESEVNLDMRMSESAHVEREDEVVRRIENRALEFQGWRGNYTIVEHPTIQRYTVDGFYNYHYDWDPSLTKGNRVTTFMVYLVDDCIGGGTNFPYLPQPDDTRWCNIIECDEDGRDGYQGVTFKPIAGSAVYWENFHPNGSAHRGVYHAGLPVKSGVKVGLNIWSWDSSWRSPEVIV